MRSKIKQTGSVVVLLMAAICFGSTSFAKPLITETLPSEHLSEIALQAVAYAPDWLRDDLKDNLSLMDEQHQEVFAQMILSPSEVRFTDEIAFCVANIPPEILQSANFIPDLLEENAFYIYEHDQYLDYVEVIDIGTPGTDESYYTTTFYTVEENGVKANYTLNRDQYYWMIVHPKIEDEVVDYCNPDASMGQHADPPTGVFWRDWLFTFTEPMPGSDDNYPILRDQMTGVDTLWKNKINDLDNGAVGVITQWLLDVLDFNSGTERPHQPVRIYKLHMGRCGEHQDIASAAARACLIPCLNSNAIGEDHVWNEFYDRRFIHWEPVNVYMDSPLTYEDGWGKKFSGVMNIDGDGYATGVLERYSSGHCQVKINVEDANNEPVDGAKVILKKGAGGVSVWDYLGSDGYTDLMFGDDIICKTRVYLNDITYPSDDFYKISEATANGATYEWTATLPFTLPTIDVTQATTTKSQANYRLHLEYSVTGEVRAGKYPYDEKSITYTRRMDGGDIDAFITDLANYDLYASSKPFQAKWFSKKSKAADTYVDLVEGETVNVVLTAERKIACKQLVTCMITILEETAGEWVAADNIFRVIELFPGERYVVTADLPQLGVFLNMPSHEFHAGDPCSLTANLENPGDADSGIPLFVVLDVLGLYYFWPTWSDDVAYQEIDLPSGYSSLPILTEFAWPENVGEYSGLKFYGAMTTPDFSRLYGEMTIWEFGWN